MGASFMLPATSSSSLAVRNQHMWSCSLLNTLHMIPPQHKGSERHSGPALHYHHRSSLIITASIQTAFRPHQGSNT